MTGCGRALNWAGDSNAPRCDFLTHTGANPARVFGSEVGESVVIENGIVQIIVGKVECSRVGLSNAMFVFGITDQVIGA